MLNCRKIKRNRRYTGGGGAGDDESGSDGDDAEGEEDEDEDTDDEEGGEVCPPGETDEAACSYRACSLEHGIATC